MTEATLIYPHQLFKLHPGMAPGRLVYLVEEPLFLTEFPIHRQKLLLHRLSMQAYAASLLTKGYVVKYLPISNTTTTRSAFECLKKDGISTVHLVDVTDMWLTKRILAACSDFEIILRLYESPLFILPKNESITRYEASKKHLAKFYQTLRKDTGILMTDEGEPLGGQWSFDADNREKIPRGIDLPRDPHPRENDDVKEAKIWLSSLEGEQYGEALQWLPYTHAGTEVWFKDFLEERFSKFGIYEDAISLTHTRLFHSAISPLLNIGLLSPQYVCDEVLRYGENHGVPINSVEGFIRQIIGWREFIRAAYECDGTAMRTRNFWGHTRSLPSAYWTGTTGIPPVDLALRSTLTYGYNHHIERLMVLGNFMLLSQIHPDEVYRWFMAMYVDAYDWVMVPNVYGMSQFADGGVFATKPYISGSNYIKKMSHHVSGEWENTWTALYWNFIETHQGFFIKNHRLSMMPRLLAKMAPEKRVHYQEIAKKYLQDLDTVLHTQL